MLDDFSQVSTCTYLWFKGIVSCYKGWLPTNEAIRPHTLAINSNSQMHSIVYSSVSNVVFYLCWYRWTRREPTACPVLSVYPAVCPSPLLDEELHIAQWIRVYNPVGALPHQLPMHRLHSWAITDDDSHSFAIRCERWSTRSSSRSCRHSESSIENLSADWSITVYSRALHRYTTRAVTQCL